mgnify:CR=1 FL=1
MMNISRAGILRIFVVAVFAVIILRLFWLQVIDSDYKARAANNVLRYEVQNPPRGEIYDRRGGFLVQSRDVYDLMVIPRETRGFDTLALCSIVGMDMEELRKGMEKAARYSRRIPSVLVKQLPKVVKLRLDELNFPGFFTVYRTIRSYPRKIAGNMLGYVGEVDERALQADSYYKPGDYIGKSGVERSYEKVLRGHKGVQVNMVDVHGVPQGSYADGMYDTVAVPVSARTLTDDARL